MKSKSVEEVLLEASKVLYELAAGLGGMVKEPEPVKERWFYSNRDHTLNNCNGVCADETCVEVPDSDLEYVRAFIARKDVDLTEWELVAGEAVDWIDSVFGSNLGARINGGKVRFVRKAKPERVQKFVEYPITIRDGHFYECGLVHIPDRCSLHELPSMVGFTGEILFQCSNKTKEWKSWGHEMTMCSSDGIPYTPIAARFYITE